MINNPHFALPFNLSSLGALQNEQDTIEDISTCVVAIMSTHLGWRDEVPEFGIPDLAFRKVPIGAADIYDMIGQQEPRAILVVEERPGIADKLLDTIGIGLSLQTKGNA
jgi:hypothetical protein